MIKRTISKRNETRILNKEKSPHEKKPIHKRVSVDGFFARLYLPVFRLIVFLGVRFFGERSEPTRI